MGGKCSNDFDKLKYYLCDEDSENLASRSILERSFSNGLIQLDSLEWLRELGAARSTTWENGGGDSSFRIVVGLADGNFYHGKDYGESETSGRSSFTSTAAIVADYKVYYLCQATDIECEEGMFPHNYASTCDKSSRNGSTVKYMRGVYHIFNLQIFLII